ncbi:MAG: GNAT family N-acetyltransferase [Chloroflexota bacterium]
MADRTSIANLMYFEHHVHRHLDWRGPLEWLGSKEYWVLEQDGQISAALACPSDPDEINWLRLFTHSSEISLYEAWNALWGNARNYFSGGKNKIAAITTADWFSDVLLNQGFSISQYIVVLEYILPVNIERPITPSIEIRTMTQDDLLEVTRVDASGFPPLWRNSFEAIRSGFQQSGFATVALVDNKIAGYQISTRNSVGVHLARLAVSREAQSRGVGFFLVQDLISRSRQEGLSRLTVNTQSDNLKSLALYKKVGFELTGERYKVFTTGF